MLKLLRKRRIAEWVSAAEAFVRINFQEPVGKIAQNSSDILYSSRESNFAYKINDGMIRYALRDHYDCNSIDAAMQRVSSEDSAHTFCGALESYIDMSFIDKMLFYIKEKQMRDSEVYKAAQIDRRLFSKMVSDRLYKPAKDTCIALSLALKLSLFEVSDILSRAGYALSHSTKRDVAIEFFFRKGIYNLNDVNEILFRLGQKPLGR